jgi:DNA polymerase III sliding clamp (beta) subunit (PCNA family)
MKMELSAKTAKAFVKAVEKMTEMCLIVFDKEGIRTRIVNNEHTAMLDVKIPKLSAEVFDFKESNPVEIGILIADIKDMTKSLVVKDALTIEYSLSDPTWLLLSANGVQKKVRCKNISLIKRHKAPTTHHKWSMMLPWKQVKAFLGSCVKDTAFELFVNTELVSLNAKSDDEKLTLDLPSTEIDLHIEGESLTTHISPATFLSLMSTTSAKTVFSAKGSDASVVETEWTESGLKLKGWVAPRT